MSNRVKVFLAFGIIGAVLLIAGFVMGSGPSALPALFSEANLPEGAVDISTVSIDDVHSVELNLNASSISIKTGENFDISGSGQFNSYVLDGVFHVGYDDTKRTANLFGMKLNAPSKWICGYGSYVLVIPQDTMLEQITINTSQCDITCDQLAAEKIDVNVKGGDLSIDKLAAFNAAVHVPNGTLTVNSSAIAEAGEITAGKSISVGTADTLSNTAMNNLSLSNSRGGITLYGILMGSSTLTANRSDIEACLGGSQDSYTLTSPGNNLAVASSSGDTDSKADTTPFALGSVTFDAKKGNANVSFMPVDLSADMKEIKKTGKNQK